MVDDQRFQTFLELSVAITGFGQVRLLGTGQAELYFATAERVVGHAIMDELLTAFSALPARTPELLRQHLFGNEMLGDVVRNLVKLWFGGVWYQLPSIWQQAYGPAAEDGTFVPSPDSYVEGLMWVAIGAHPAGAKAPGFASWAVAPQIPSA
jgi:hypothetical protein